MEEIVIDNAEKYAKSMSLVRKLAKGLNILKRQGWHQFGSRGTVVLMKDTTRAIAERDLKRSGLKEKITTWKEADEYG